MVTNPLEKNRELRAASSGRVGLGGEVVSKKLKKKTKGDVEKDKKLFQRLDSGGYKKKVIGVGKKGLLEVKKATADAPTTSAKEKEAAKKKVFVYRDAEAGIPGVKETGPLKAGGNGDDDGETVLKNTPVASTTWEKHKDEESGHFYYYNPETNETTWEDPK
ncbi:hypothetical protein TrRE_jg6286 [Triparma retinervis]|uniref:WW domain-containing protein n=1 Tax=Triparma retinervis TaxID=2557542 RepID=A0A9W7AQF4_9STRA|nr:hypothetical protein TrRE_jg6286 [Triparma retinervis]